MQAITRLFAVLIILTAAAPVLGEWYFLRDYQYFRPMIADIRTTNNHTRYLYDEALRYTDEKDPGSRHLQWDVGFSEYFPMLGVDWGDPELEPLERSGITLFVDGGAHMLLDFNAPSAAVINTDFRAGIGVAMRFWDPADWLSARVHWFHESTHLGDEYILLGVNDPDFRRYNPSYEATSLFLAADHFADWDDSFPAPVVGLPLSYVRGYAGVRTINNRRFTGYDRTFSKRDPLKTTGDPETQLGGELFFRGWKPVHEPGASFFKEWLQWQHVVVAVEWYHRDRYDPVAPENSWSRTIVIGLIYGDHFNTQSEPTMKWLLNFYDGVHPHGQFRSEADDEGIQRNLQQALWALGRAEANGADLAQLEEDAPLRGSSGAIDGDSFHWLD